MAGEMSPDDGYALLQDAGPQMDAVRAALLLRRKQAGRNMGAQADPTVRTLPAARMAALMGNGVGQSFASVPSAAPDPNADTPQDIARKAALSQLVLRGSGPGSTGEVSGGDAATRQGMQQKIADPRMLAMRRAQSDQARDNAKRLRDNAGAYANTHPGATADEIAAYGNGRPTVGGKRLAAREASRLKRLQHANDQMAPILALTQAQNGAKPGEAAQANLHNATAEAIRAQLLQQYGGGSPGMGPMPGQTPPLGAGIGPMPGQVPPGQGGIKKRPRTIFDEIGDSGNIFTPTPMPGMGGPGRMPGGF